MRTEVFWTKEKYPGRIALVPRPRGGDWLEDEAAAWANANLDVIVSMLDAEETVAFELEREAEFCASVGIEFISLSVADRDVPVISRDFLQLVQKLKTLISEGKNVGIHCRQSVGRAPLLAAVLMTRFGIEPAEAFRRLSVARGVEVPETNEQRKWAEQFAGKPAKALV